MCAASVQFVLRHERDHGLRFAALDSQVGRSIRSRHPDVAGIDTMVWVEPLPDGRERVLVRSTAALRVARYLGGLWRLAAIAYLVPRSLRDALYAFVARHRHQLTRGGEQCYLPPPAMRPRFLDQNT